MPSIKDYEKRFITTFLTLNGGASSETHDFTNAAIVSGTNQAYTLVKVYYWSLYVVMTKS